MKNFISLILIAIMLVSSCIVAGAAESGISLKLPDGKIYSDITELEAEITGDKDVSEIIFKLDGEEIGNSANGILEINSGTLTPGNHILEAVAIFADKSAAVDKESIKVYKKYSDNNNSISLGSKWHGRTVTTVTGMFGDDDTKESSKVQFSSSSQSNFGYSLPDPIKTSYGDEIVFGFSVGAETTYDLATGTSGTGTSELISFGISYDALLNDRSTQSVSSASLGIGINFYAGKLTNKGNDAELEDYNMIPCGAGVWNKYEYKYTVGRGIIGDSDYVPNKLSIYKNGALVLDNYSIGTADKHAITQLNGISMFERKRGKCLYFQDIFLTYKKSDYGVESTSYLEEDTWKEFTDNIPSASDKLKIKFNKAMDKTTLIPDNFSIISDKSDKAVSDVVANSDGSEATLTIPGGFEKGESLKLIVSDEIVDASTTAVGEELVLRFKTEAAPLMPDNAEYTVNSDSALVSTAQLKNGDTVGISFDFDIPPEETDGVAVYLCIRENKKLVSIKPCIINSSGDDITITSDTISGLSGNGDIEVKLIICDDFVASKPYSIIVLD